jgi:Family of unknown function (DUF6011)
MELDVAAEELRKAIPTMTGSSRGFAESLIKSFNRGYVSPKQSAWIVKLAKQATTPTTPESEPVQVNVVGIVNLLRVAGSRLKFPKIRMVTEAGEKLVVSVAGARSKYAGHVMLTDGGPFGANRYYGRIDLDGKVHDGRDMTATIMQLLRTFADNPAGVAAAYGKRTGACCFCSRELETRESLAVGYGPTCAEHYGLPWG